MSLENKQRRLLLPSTTSTHTEQKKVAFSAYISQNLDAQTAVATHTFVYDTVITNDGNAYSNYTGAFTVPTSGVYALLWTVAVEGEKLHSSDSEYMYGEITTELVVNVQVHADTESYGDDEESTGFVILRLNSGDVVYIRSLGSEGILQKRRHQQWTFSGWQIM